MECSNKCHSMQHASFVFSAITKTNDEEKILNFLQIACPNVSINKDLDRKFAIHVAASMGKIKIIDWLLSNQAQINIKDQESGYSPLHRAVFCGQLQAVRLLINRQANLLQLDNDRLTCIDHLIQDRFPPIQIEEPVKCAEVYVWGTNYNYTLGQKNQRNIPFPELLDHFRKENNCSMKCVVINKFHSVFVDQSGQVFTCGHGHGGRLGHNSEHSVITPTKLKSLKDEVCVQAAIGIDHTILLMETGSVWSCGMNQFNQLGHNPPPAQLLAPKCIGLFSGKGKSSIIKGISTSRFHSIFWNSNSIFTCGLNAGQLGHLKGDDTVIIPKQVSSLRGQVDVEIICVAASDGATAIATNRGDVYLLHEYQCRKIASKQSDIVKIAMIGGNLDSSIVPTDLLSDHESIKLQVILLSTTGKISIWSSLNPSLTRCFFQASPQIFVKDIALSNSMMSIISRQGQGFTGKLVQMAANHKTKIAKTSNNHQTTAWAEFCQKEQSYVQIKLKRIAGIHRAVGITCDPEGKNFATIQVHPSIDLLQVPHIVPCRMAVDLKQLLIDAHPDDQIHDIVFLVDRQKFAAHRLILATYCKTFYKEYCLNEPADQIVHLPGISADLFQLVLEFIYSGTCALLENAPCPLRSATRVYGNEIPGKDRDPTRWSYGDIKCVQQCSVKLNVDSLTLLLDKVKIKNGNVIITEGMACRERNVLNRRSKEDLSDVSICSQDGKTFRAHRSILSARLDYFQSMFGCGWIETFSDRTISLPVHSTFLEVILDFVYEGCAKKIDKSDDVEFICNCLSVADQLLVCRLVAICESSLVRLLTLKNVGQVLEFASVYNAPQLKISCMQFICLNLTAVVESRSWDCVSDEIMEELTSYYRQFHPAMVYRVITPSSIAPSSQQLDSYVSEDNKDRENDTKRSKGRAKHVRKASETKERLTSTCSNISTDCDPQSAELHREILFTAPNSDKTQFTDWSTVKKSSKREKSSGKSITSSSITSTTETFSYQSPTKSPAAKKFPEAEPAASVSQNQPTLYESATIIQTTPQSSLKSKKFPKLSQKQRRINGMAVADTAAAESSSVVNQTKTPNVWNNISDKDHHDRQGQSTIDLAMPAVTSTEVKTPLRSIIASEQQQNRNFITVRSKPLKITLMEEEAMTDLRKFYQTDDVHEEYIVVERVTSGLVATPIWRSPQK